MKIICGLQTVKMVTAARGKGTLTRSATKGGKTFTGRGHDWADRFKKVARDIRGIKASSGVDGKMIVSAANGTTDFAVLQNGRRHPDVEHPDVLSFSGRAELKKIAKGTNLRVSL